MCINGHCLLSNGDGLGPSNNTVTIMLGINYSARLKVWENVLPIYKLLFIMNFLTHQRNLNFNDKHKLIKTLCF